LARKIKESPMTVKIVRLTSGEEVIASVSEIEDGIHLKSPALILPTGQGSIGLMPWMPYADHDGGIDLQNSFVVFTIKPHDELINEYNTAFGNGLIVPPKQKVSGPALTLTE